MKIWIVSREYAGIAEAGGVKNVTCSLAEQQVSLGNLVTVFMPRYGCSDVSGITDYVDNPVPPVLVTVNKKDEHVSFSCGFYRGVRILFINNPFFMEKQGIYTYTKDEQDKDGTHVRGQGHVDAALTDIIFQKAVVAYGIASPERDIPDLVHCQDAATALVPSFIKNAGTVFNKTRCIVTIHNAGPGYHHSYNSKEEAAAYTGLPLSMIEEGMFEGCFEPFILASRYAVLTTVSPYYAQELLDPQNNATGGLSRALFERNCKITGITNGIDIDRYAPQCTEKSMLPFAFDPEKKDLLGKYACRRYFLERYGKEKTNGITDSLPVQYGFLMTGKAEDRSEPVYLCYQGRLVRQKGIEILLEAADRLLSSDPTIRLVIIGQGEVSLEKAAAALAAKYTGQCLYFCGYTRVLSRLCVAVADFMLLPSDFEPCGLEDFIGQLFGTLPVAHATGGLKKIIDGRTGFLYTPNTADALYNLLSALVCRKQENTTAFNNMIACAASYVKESYSWDSVVQNHYQPLYRKVCKV